MDLTLEQIEEITGGTIINSGGHVMVVWVGDDQHYAYIGIDGDEFGNKFIGYDLYVNGEYVQSYDLHSVRDVDFQYDWIKTEMSLQQLIK